jgi:site-specific DNA-methyltransferase (adenine-specific)
LLPKVADRQVDLVLCDLPYGATDCEWDHRIDCAALWREYERVLSPQGTVVLFSMLRFAVELINAAPRDWLRYEWIWDKAAATGWLSARHRPMPQHEHVLVFAPEAPRYYPQGLRACAPRTHTASSSSVYGKCDRAHGAQTVTGWPKTILRFPREVGAKAAQKPVALLEYLVRTYTHPGELVLDNTMGLGSTGVAALNAGRRFVGMELDGERFAAARSRVEAAHA